MIQLSEEERAIVEGVLKKYPYTFYVFGSRAKGTGKPLSDLDLCVLENLPLSDRAKLDADFSESNLPFKVDIVSYPECDEAFKQRIQSDLIYFK